VRFSLPTRPTLKVAYIGVGAPYVSGASPADSPACTPPPWNQSEATLFAPMHFLQR